MREALHAEWTKLRTTTGPAGLLLAAIASTMGVGAIATHAVARSTVDTTKLALTGVDLGQAVVATLAVAVLCGEYSTGMIRTTLAAMPRRITVLTAKAAVVTAVVLVAGLVGTVGSLLIGQVPLTGGSTLRAAGGSVLYLALIGLLGLGIAAAVRDSALATGLVLTLLYLFPILIGVVSDARLQRHLEQIAPMNAGLVIQTTKNLAAQPIGPWAGLGVVAAWAAGALLIGAAVLQFRDA